MEIESQHVTRAKLPIGTRVRKIKGSSWNGVVVGYYSTTLTPDGYCVESEREPGSVQIYSRAAIAVAASDSFKPCVTVDDKMGIATCLFEDVPHSAVPLDARVPHFIDELKAFSDGRLVGMQVWLTPKTVKRNAPESSRGAAAVRALAALPHLSSAPTDDDRAMARELARPRTGYGARSLEDDILAAFARMRASAPESSQGDEEAARWIARSSRLTGADQNLLRTERQIEQDILAALTRARADPVESVGELKYTGAATVLSVPAAELMATKAAEAMRDRCEAIARGEKVDADSTGEESDKVYNLACDHVADAIAALRAPVSEDAPITQADVDAAMAELNRPNAGDKARGEP